MEQILKHTDKKQFFPFTFAGKRRDLFPKLGDKYYSEKRIKIFLTDGACFSYGTKFIFLRNEQNFLAEQNSQPN